MKLNVRITVCVLAIVAITVPAFPPCMARGGGHPAPHPSPRPNFAAQHQAQAQAHARQAQANHQRQAQANQQRQAQANHQRQAQANHQRQAQANQQRQAQANQQRQAQANQQRQAQANQQRQAQANQQRQAQANQQRQAQANQQRQAQANQQRQSFDRNHPGRAEVLGRDARLSHLLNQDKGDLNGNFGRLKNRDASIRRQEQFDAAHNGGHLTAQEHRQLNSEENGLRNQISRDNSGVGDAQFQRNHPLRSEALGRDAKLNASINQDKGDLGGHYYQLRRQDAGIRHQEQYDAAHNGGHLTGQEYRQINGEENGLRNRISRDNSGAGDAQFQRNHPLRSETLGRDAKLNASINQDKGDLGGHYYQLRRQDANIQHQEQYDAAHNGGHLTGQEYRQINGEENGLRNRISRDNSGVGDALFQRNHPLRSEVLGRDANLSNTLSQDKGNLSGQYYQLRRRDASIKRQEQYDAAHNGGHLTGQEYQTLNNEENALRGQVSTDHQ